MWITLFFLLLTMFLPFATIKLSSCWGVSKEDKTNNNSYLLSLWH